MKTFDRINNYLNDNKFRMTIYDNYAINIINYDEIKEMSLTKIVVTNEKKNIIIEGLNLTINKMLNNETLIEGQILSIRIN